MKLFNKQSLAVLKDKKLIIAIVAVIFVPILYAGMFLWAFWDPYAYLDDIPVAIVNEDEPYEYEGEQLHLGDELVDRLKDEDDFDFHFVERQQGYKGLKNEEYYILIEIPRDFSENATTIMDDSPKKLRLRYVPNESYNFLAAQIGETAMLQIEMALEEKITENYTEIIFEKVTEIADGLDEANDATKKLTDGTNELNENTHLLNHHLETLAEKTIEFSKGTAELHVGANELVTGTNELANGINQLYGASNGLLNGAKQLTDGQKKLNKGISVAQQGSYEINRHVPNLINGTEQFGQGLKQVEQQLPRKMAEQLNSAILLNSSQINDGLTELENAIITGLGSTNDREGLAPQLANGINEQLETELNDVSSNLNQLRQNLAGHLAEVVANEITMQQQVQTEKLFHELQNANFTAEQISFIKTELEKNSLNKNELQTKLNTNITNQLAIEFENIDTYIRDKQIDIQSNIQDSVYYAVGKTEENITNGFKQFSKQVADGINNATSNTEGMIASGVQSTFLELEKGLDTIQSGQKQLHSGLNELSNGLIELQIGSKTIVSGQNEFVSNMDLFTNKFSTANEGANTLSSGTNQLSEGIVKLDEGAAQISDGAHELASGSRKLASGTETLSDGARKFHEEITDATEQVNDIDANDETYNMMANPVDVDYDKINEVPNYGTGFAPYFLSLGLYVGALLLSIVYPLREPSVVPSSGFNWFLRKTVGLSIIGILQAIIAASVLLFGLKIEVQSVMLFYVYTIIASLTFIALIQFLVTCFDDPGRFMAIIILILQLTTSAGTFPLELIPKVLQPLNAILPMTYTVSGFKAVISSGEYNVMWQQASILFMFTIIALLLTFSYFAFMFKRKFATMQKAS